MKKQSSRMLNQATAVLGKDSPKLWKEIINKIPKSTKCEFKRRIATGKSIRILNIAAGYGTEAKILVKLLHRLGMSIEEIKNSIYLIDNSTEMCNQLKILGFTNVIREDFLKWETNLKFDIVIGNPPYQGSKSGGGSGSGNSIWQDFVIKAFSLCKDDGFVSLIHPMTWRLENTKSKLSLVKQLIANKQMIWAKFGIKPFTGVRVVVDVYVSQNSVKTTGTRIEFKDGESILDLNDAVSGEISSFGSTLFRSIVSKTLAPNNIEKFYSRKSWGGLTIFDESAESASYQYVHGGNYLENKFRIKPKSHIHQFHPKVITTALNFPKPQFDHGEFGIGDHIHYQLVDSEEEGLALKCLWESKLMSFLIKAYEFHTIAYSTFPLRRIKPLPLVMSNSEIYKYYDLTQEEINLIEETIK